MAYVKKPSVISAQSGTGASSLISFHGNVLHKHSIFASCSVGSGTITIQLLDGDSDTLLAPPATFDAAELTAKEAMFTFDGYPAQSVKVNVSANSSGGTVTCSYTGTD